MTLGKLDKMTEDSFDPQMLEDMMEIIGAICEIKSRRNKRLAP